MSLASVDSASFNPGSSNMVVPVEALYATENPQTPSPGRALPNVYVECKDTCNCICPYVEAKKPQPHQRSPPVLTCCEKCCKCAIASK